MVKVAELRKDEEKRAINIHQSSIFIQMADTTWPGVFDEEYVAQLKSSGVTGLGVVATWKSGLPRKLDQALEDIFVWNGKIKDLGLRQATTAEDIRKAKRDGQIAVIRGWQNVEAIGYDRSLLTIFHKLGIRSIGMAYQRRNLLADGCGERTDSGLSKFGVSVVEEMNRLGILIDLSHVGRKSSLDAIELSKKPVIFSHSGVHALCPHLRNLTDEVMQALAEKDGVMGIPAFSVFLRQQTDPNTLPATSVEDYMDHIDYAVKLMGVDHVAIGLDMSYKRKLEDWAIAMVPDYPEVVGLVPESEFDKKFPADMSPASKWPNITKGLVARGYSDGDIKKILGDNMLRVYEEVWGG